MENFSSVKIYIFGFNGESSVPIMAESPWLAFIEVLKDNGFEIIEKDKICAATLCVFNSVEHKDINFCDLKNVPIKNRILILWEPPATRPKIYENDLQEDFGLIFTPSNLWISNSKTRYFHWPQVKVDFSGKTTLDNRIKKSVFIGANKISFHNTELYSLRRSLLKADNNKLIDVYGIGWSSNFAYRLKTLIGTMLKTSWKSISLQPIFGYFQTKVTNPKGTCVDKFQISERYRFALVVENSRDYVSEKLFDALFSKCICFYIGPDLNSFGFPSELAIQLDGKPKDILIEIKKHMDISSIDHLLSIQNKQQKAFENLNTKNNNIRVFSDLAEQVSIYGGSI
jgi:hypothetical protein